jgi:hypothetical protein
MPTLYWAIYPTADGAPTAAELIAASRSPAFTDTGNVDVVVTDYTLPSIDTTALTPETSYTIAATVSGDPAGTVRTSSSFTTLTFDPLHLFSNNEEGAFYDFSNLATLRQNSDGTTAVTDYGDPVGFVLDQSKGSSTLTDNLGAEELADPGFDNPSAWNSPSANWTISGSQATASATGNLLTAAAPIVEGVFYQIVIDIESIAAGSIDVRLGGGDAGNQIEYISSAGVHTFYAKSPGVSFTGEFVLRKAGATGAVVLNSVSVREVPGNHLTQSTSTARPLLARVPVGGRRNLINASEELDNASWISDGSRVVVSGNTLTANEQLSPRTLFIRQTFAYDASAAYTIFADVEDNGGRYAWIGSFDDTTGFGAMFDLQTGTFVGYRTGVGTPSGNSITDLGGGIYRISMSFTTSASPASSIYGAQIGLSSDGDLDWSTTYDGTESIIVHKYQLEESATATPYQKVTAAYDITESGKADVVGLLFDGLEDSLVSPSIDLTSATGVTQAAGAVQNGPDGVNSRLVDGPAGGEIGFNTGDDLIYTNMSAGSNVSLSKNFDLRSPASIIRRSDKSAPISKQLVNGDSSQSTSSLGAGNFLDSQLHVGERDTGGGQFPGLIFSALLIDRYITDEETTELETYLEDKAGVE